MGQNQARRQVIYSGKLNQVVSGNQRLDAMTSTELNKLAAAYAVSLAIKNKTVAQMVEHVRLSEAYIVGLAAAVVILNKIDKHLDVLDSAKSGQPLGKPQQLEVIRDD